MTPRRHQLSEFVSTAAWARSDTKMLVGAHWAETECVR